MRPERIVEILAPGRRGRRGSGYLLDGRLVLTSGHVVDRAAAGRFRVRALAGGGWAEATVAWRGEGCDAALLALRHRVAEVGVRARLGRIAGREPVSCVAVGFPEAQARTHSDPIVYEPEQIAGLIYPITGAKSQLLSITVTSGDPDDRSDGSPWRGASGAAVFSSGLLVGVLRGDPDGFGRDRLDATSVSAIAGESGFRVLLGADALGLEAVEAQGLLEPAYERWALSDGAAPPSFLLHPRYGVVRFRGRDEELGWLRAWCGGEPPVEVALLTGRGGTGKSRVARELCRRVAVVDGWVTGLLERDAPAAELRGLARLDTGLLAVVDYAETRQAQVIALLTALAAERDPAASLRVLLIARWEGDWWPGLPAKTHQTSVRQALARAAARELAPAEPSIEGRTDAYLHARAAFERFTGPPPSRAVPVLSDRIFEQLLFVHIKALSDLPGGDRQLRLLGGAARSIREDLLDDTLSREAVHWHDTADAVKLTVAAATRASAVAVATLATPNAASAPTNAPQTARLLAVLHDLDEPLRFATARWLHDLYPTSEGWIAPLEPDLLGEALVARVLQLDGEDAGRELLGDLIGALTPDGAHRALTVLTRAAADHPVCDNELHELIATRLERLWKTALSVAMETGDPIGRHLAAALERTPHPELATAIAKALPEQTVALRELAALATRHALQHASASNADQGELAAIATGLAIRLVKVGHPEDALAAIDVAVDAYRRLTRRRTDIFLPDLAIALNDQAGCLSELGRREDALAASDEAVTIQRRLADARPDAFLRDLARSLNGQSLRLRDLGRREDALAASDEAVTIHRGFADASLPDLAASLTSQSLALSDLGRREDALAASDEAVTIQRRLADARPDAFLPDLGMSLTNQASCLRDLERREDALAASDEAVTLHRALARARPAAFETYLAASLSGQSLALSELGRHEDALAASDEAVTIRRRLADARPDAFLPDLARSLNGQSRRLMDLGHCEDALAAIEEAITFYQTLATADPASSCLTSPPA